MATTEPQTFTHVIDGVELHWSVRGAGTDIVVLHGLCDSERSWWPVMAELGRQHRVFGLDLPDCGLSGRPDASYTIDWQARLVAAWLDELGITECDVIGHSYGGGLGMWLLLYRGLCDDPASPTGGRCHPSGCVTDQDCQPGYNCASHRGACDEAVPYACQKPEDTCAVDTDCANEEGAQLGFGQACRIQSDGHRACEPRSFCD